MGSIVQRSSTITDSGLLTASFWCIPPGYPDANGASNFMWLFSAETADYFGFNIRYQALSTGTNTLQVIGGVSDLATGYAVEWRVRPDSIQFGSWNHFFIAADATPGGSSDKAYVYIDAVRQPLGTSGIPSDTYSTSTTAPYNNNFFDYSQPIEFGFSGADLGIPNPPENLTFAPKVQYADFQMWIGTFIDPTDPTNFAKFVSVSDGVGTPVDPAIAASAFGEQTLLHMGGADAFFINRGTGGTFTKSGTIGDFTPTPSYA